MSDGDFINTKSPTYEVHSATGERKLREIAGILKGSMPFGWGFTLFIFEYGDEVDHGSMFYASSSDRDDMIKVLREFIAKQEKSFKSPKDTSADL